MGKYGGFGKEHLPSDPPGVPCESCGMDVATTGTSGKAVNATCAWCVNQGPVRDRKPRRLAKRKSGLRK